MKTIKVEYVMIALGLVLGYLNLCGCSVKLVKLPTEGTAQYEQK